MSVKVIVLLSVVATLATIALAGPVESELRSNMNEAFANGMKKFDPNRDSTRKETGEVATSVDDKYKGALPFSQYTAKQGVSVSGGKPTLSEQYRGHHYTPLAPSKVPHEAKSAKDRYVPQRPLQFSTDKLHISANVH